jgi:hypothetical protein
MSAQLRRLRMNMGWWKASRYCKTCLGHTLQEIRAIPGSRPKLRSVYRHTD